ncbi:MOSC domain-containing protein [Nostocoides sp. HKS02]|nr:MOSC domain-containing protein [Tetrasphaera sp. HKS02]
MTAGVDPGLGRFPVVSVTRYPVKSMGGESLDLTEVGASGLMGDRAWAVYDGAGKLASGKHSRRFRRMDPVFALTAQGGDGHTVVHLPDGSEVVAGSPEADSALSAHFGEPVWLRTKTAVAHQDAAEVSLVGTATLAELGRIDAGGPVAPGHLRTNLVIETTEPYAEDAWAGRELTIGSTVLRVVEPIERCRMVGVAQVGLSPRPRLVADHRRPPSAPGGRLCRGRQTRPDQGGGPGPSRLTACPRCRRCSTPPRTSSPPRPSGSTCWWATGSSSRTCPSPTWSCGSRPAWRGGSPSRTCGPPRARWSSSRTWSGVALIGAGSPCSTRPTSTGGSSVRRTPSSATTCRCARRPSPSCGPAGRSRCSRGIRTSRRCARRAGWS